MKEFRVAGNLKNPNTKMIMTNTTPHTEMRTKVIYSFKSEIHRGAGEVVDHSKTLTSPPGMFTSLKEIQVCIEECEQKMLDLDDEKHSQRLFYPPKEQLKHGVIMKAM